MAFLLLFTRFAMVTKRPHPGVAGWGTALRVLVVGQMALGLVNMMLLAPVTLQVAHLLVADLLWIALLLMLARALVVVDESPTSDRQPITSVAREPSPSSP